MTMPNLAGLRLALPQVHNSGTFDFELGAGTLVMPRFRVSLMQAALLINEALTMSIVKISSGSG
jgi:hypothetical protein